MKSRAVVFPRPMEAAVQEVELPKLGEQEVLIGIQASAISPGTERWCLTDRMVIPGKPPLAFPHVPGYQAAGQVVEVGGAVRSLRPGQRVFSRNCRAPDGWPGSWWGGHVGHHVADEEAVIPLPESVSTDSAAGLLLAQVGYNGAMKPPVSPGDTAVVIGEGLVGQYAAQVLRHRGARVIVAGLSSFRLELARRFSADEVFDSCRGELAAFVRERCPRGVQIVVETASSAATVRLGAELLAYGGHLVLNGYYPPPESVIDWHWLRGKELTIHCPNSRTRERLESTLELVARGVLEVDALTTHAHTLEQAPAAYARLLEPAADYLGMIIHWTSEGRNPA
ncbi:MAG: zinc-binding dehydrogenase [Spirochaetales bacterium]|nr:zinc-binding dehydrogenase [Spirochaetales bacterium]